MRNKRSHLRKLASENRKLKIALLRAKKAASHADWSQGGGGLRNRAIFRGSAPEWETEHKEYKVYLGNSAKIPQYLWFRKKEAPEVLKYMKLWNKNLEELIKLTETAVKARGKTRGRGRAPSRALGPGSGGQGGIDPAQLKRLKNDRTIRPTDRDVVRMDKILSKPDPIREAQNQANKIRNVSKALGRAKSALTGRGRGRVSKLRLAVAQIFLNQATQLGAVV